MQCSCQNIWLSQEIGFTESNGIITVTDGSSEIVVFLCMRGKMSLTKVLLNWLTWVLSMEVDVAENSDDNWFWTGSINSAASAHAERKMAISAFQFLKYSTCVNGAKG